MERTSCRGERKVFAQSKDSGGRAKEAVPRLLEAKAVPKLHQPAPVPGSSNQPVRGTVTIAPPPPSPTYILTFIQPTGNAHLPPFLPPPSPRLLAPHPRAHLHPGTHPHTAQPQLGGGLSQGVHNSTTSTTKTLRLFRPMRRSKPKPPPRSDGNPLKPKLLGTLADACVPSAISIAKFANETKCFVVVNSL